MLKLSGGGGLLAGKEEWNVLIRRGCEQPLTRLMTRACVTHSTDNKSTTTLLKVAPFRLVLLHHANEVKEKNGEQPGVASPENGSLATLATRIL